MPHVAIKLFPGRSKELKQKLADEITKKFIEVFGSSEPSISISFEDVEQKEWMKKIYEPEIAGKSELLFKKPGYTSV